jgi:hypothetical protein
MLSLGLWRWYIYITINILDIYLKNDVSETGFCLRLQVKPTELGAIDIASLCLRTICKAASVRLIATI